MGPSASSCRTDAIRSWIRSNHAAPAGALLTLVNRFDHPYTDHMLDPSERQPYGTFAAPEMPQKCLKMQTNAIKMVPPERLELSPPAPEAGALSTELRGPEPNITPPNRQYRLSLVSLWFAEVVFLTPET
jgi:hypothetical protein